MYWYVASFLGSPPPASARTRMTFDHTRIDSCAVNGRMHACARGGGGRAWDRGYWYELLEKKLWYLPCASAQEGSLVSVLVYWMFYKNIAVVMHLSLSLSLSLIPPPSPGFDNASQYQIGQATVIISDGY